MASSRAKTDLGVKVENNLLKIGEVTVTFNRTLRIPDDGGSYPLPPGLGNFPVRRVVDYQARVPENWRQHGGVFLPMYQREALWLRFSARPWKPNALKVAVGKVCALTGKPWTESLHNTPDKQDYVVVPTQPWIDGINSGNDTVRQFVAMPLGMGYTVEGQVTGEEKHGGLQLCVFEAKAGIFPDRPPYGSHRISSPASDSSDSDSFAQTDGVGPKPKFGGPSPAKATRQAATTSLFGSVAQAIGSAAARPGAAGPSASLKVDRSKAVQTAAPPSPFGMEMGLAAGGRMRQEIYADPRGLSVWDQSSYSRVFVHLCNSEMWREITGEPPPESPVTAQTYAQYGLPWYEVYDEGHGGIDASPILAGVKSVKEMDAAKGFGPLQDDSSVSVNETVVFDGNW